jgi:GNAT superfamily N-acetyltransferase
VEIRDERDPLARLALKLIVEMFPPSDRQSTSALLSEVAESRMELLEGDGFHLFTALSEEGRPMGTAIGVYLRAVNAGFILYIAVRPEYRSREAARTLRRELAMAFREDAKRNGRGELAWVIGEIEAESAWLRRLVRERNVIPSTSPTTTRGCRPAAATGSTSSTASPSATRARRSRRSSSARSSTTSSAARTACRTPWCTPASPP